MNNQLQNIDIVGKKIKFNNIMSRVRFRQHEPSKNICFAFRAFVPLKTEISNDCFEYSKETLKNDDILAQFDIDDDDEPYRPLRQNTINEDELRQVNELWKSKKEEANISNQLLNAANEFVVETLFDFNDEKE